LGKETEDPKKAVAEADVVVTDTWVSIGKEKEKKTNFIVFRS